MKFDEFWNRLSKEFSSSRTIHTLKQGKEFKVRISGDNAIVIPGTQYRRYIAKSEFHKIWNIALGITNAYRPSNYSKSTYNASYILATMKHILNYEEIE